MGEGEASFGDEPRDNSAGFERFSRLKYNLTRRASLYGRRSRICIGRRAVHAAQIAPIHRARPMSYPCYFNGIPFNVPSCPVSLCAFVHPVRARQVPSASLYLLMKESSPLSFRFVIIHTILSVWISNQRARCFYRRWFPFSFSFFFFWKTCTVWSRSFNFFPLASFFFRRVVVRNGNVSTS